MKKILNRLRPFLLLSFFVVLSCQEDYVEYSPQGSSSGGKFKYITFEELKSKPKAYEALRPFLKANKDVYYRSYLMTVVTDSILIYTDGVRESLTFQVIPDEERGLLENLVLNLQGNGTYSAYHTAYDLTEEELDKVQLNQSIGLARMSINYLHDFDNSRLHLKSNGGGGNIYVGDDGNCYKQVVNTLQSWSNIPGQLEASEVELAEVRVPCPEEPDDQSSGGGAPPVVIYYTVPYFNNQPYVPRVYPPGGAGPRDITTKPTITIRGPRRECKKIADRIESAIGNLEYRDKIVDLAQNVTDTQNEHGMSVDTEGNFVTLTPGPSLQPNLNPTHKLVSFDHIHNDHPDGTYSVFSFADLRTLSVLLDNDKIEVSEFVATLSTSKGTHYALTISDASKFKKFFYYWNNISSGSNIWTVEEWKESEKKATILEKIYYTNKIPRIKQTDTNNEAVLKEFLDFLRKADMGVTLFEADASFENFIEVTKPEGSNEIVKKPCTNLR